MSEHEKHTLKQAYNTFAKQRENTPIEDWKVNERQDFFHHLSTEGKVSLLEIGAGPGRDSLYFQEQGLNVVSVDFSDEMVKLCKDKGLEAYCMDFHQLNFEDRHFDSVFALNCLLHVSKANIDRVLSEIHRVLKPGGLFFYGVYGGQNTEGVWEKDFYEPKRFFSMYLDADIVQVVGEWFKVEDFHIVSMSAGTPHFQSLLLRKEETGG